MKNVYDIIMKNCCQIFSDIVENNYEERAYILLDNYRNDLIREKLNRSYEITKRRKHNG